MYQGMKVWVAAVMATGGRGQTETEQKNEIVLTG